MSMKGMGMMMGMALMFSRMSLGITEVGDFETLTYPPTEIYNSERNNRTGTRPQFWLYCVIGRLLLSK